MDNRKNIVQELNGISPVVAQIGFHNPYAVPEGYFNRLPGLIRQRIQGGEEDAAPGFPQKKDNPYTVPQGYFENLPAAMLQRVKAQEAPGAGEELETLSPLLSSIGKKMPFSTPAGYFDELEEQSVAGAQAIEFVNGELENLSPVMQSLQNKTAYEVPAGYFEQLPAQLLEKVKEQPTSRVITMQFTRRIIRYAAAAVVAGLIIAAAWFYFLPGGNSITGPKSTLAEIEQLSDEVLENYLADVNIPLTETPVIAANDELDAEDMREMLADIPDEELQRYVEQNQLKDIITN